MPFEANIIHKIDIKAQRSFYCALLSSLDNRKMYSQLVLLDEYRLVLYYQRTARCAPIIPFIA
jgi:hypothetical protein